MTVRHLACGSFAATYLVASYTGAGVVVSWLEAVVPLAPFSAREVVVLSVAWLPSSVLLFERGQRFFKTFIGFLLFGVSVAVLFSFSTTSGFDSGLLSEFCAAADESVSATGATQSATIVKVQVDAYRFNPNVPVGKAVPLFCDHVAHDWGKPLTQENVVE